MPINWEQQQLPDSFDPQKRQAARYQLGNMKQQSELNTLNINQEKQEVQQAQAYRDAFAQGGSLQEIRGRLQAAGAGDMVLKIDETLSQLDVDKLTKLSKELEINQTKANELSSKAAAILRMSPDQRFEVARSLGLPETEEGLMSLTSFADLSKYMKDAADEKRAAAAEKRAQESHDNPKPTGEMALYYEWKKEPEQQKPGADLSLMKFRREWTAASASPNQNQPSAVTEYNFYKQQEEAAGRKPLGFNEYQNMDANRRRQMVNINLEKIRELDIANRTDAAPGQIVFKSSGNPVPTTQVPETAAVRLEGLQTAIQQADVVEKALMSLGDSGAIKGYVEENGVYWPVVQDALTPEQVAAVSETNRMLSAYAQAVSGLAVSEPEIARLQKSAPSVKLTPEANKVIIGHFRRNAIAKRDNYLNIRGWKFKEEAAPTPAAGAGRVFAANGAQRIYTDDGGKTWIDEKTGQPVK